MKKQQKRKIPIHQSLCKPLQCSGQFLQLFRPLRLPKGSRGDNKHYRYARVKLNEIHPKHTQTRKIAYNSKTKAGIQAHAPKKVRSDKFKTGKEELLDKEILKEDDMEIIIKMMPTMVKTSRRQTKNAKV
ncbi:DNA-directed RNA polymerases IV and V subunit 2, partial [Mucuna pruriens]